MDPNYFVEPAPKLAPQLQNRNCELGFFFGPIYKVSCCQFKFKHVYIFRPESESKQRKICDDQSFKIFSFASMTVRHVRKTKNIKYFKASVSNWNSPNESNKNAISHTFLSKKMVTFLLSQCCCVPSSGNVDLLTLN